MELTFRQLHNDVTTLTNEVSQLKRLLLNNSNQRHTEEPEQFFNVREAADFLSLTVATIYSKTSKGELPFMKRGKRLYFSNIELLDYLKGGRKKSDSEIVAEAHEYLLNNKKGLNNGK